MIIPATPLYCCERDWHYCGVLILLIVGVIDVSAEYVCMQYLVSSNVDNGSDRLMMWAITVSLVLLAIVPCFLVVQIAQWKMLASLSMHPALKETFVGRWAARLSEAFSANDEEDRDIEQGQSQTPRQ